MTGARTPLDALSLTQGPGEVAAVAAEALRFVNRFTIAAPSTGRPGWENVGDIYRVESGRQRIAEPQPVGEPAKSMQAHVGDDPLARPFYHHRDRAVSVHLAGALLARLFRRVDNVRIACLGGTSADGPAASSPSPVNDRG